jgi:hypothetical protein
LLDYFSSPSLFRSPFPFPIPGLCALPFPGPFLAAQLVLLTLAIVIVIAISRTAAFTAWRSGIRQVLIIIILIDYLTPIQWFSSQGFAWPVLPAAWRLILCLGITTTGSREILAGAFNLYQDGYLRIEAIDWIPDGTGVVPHSMVHLVMGCVRYT